MRTLTTARFTLVSATPASLRAALAGPDALAASLAAVVPATWPPEFLDDAALQYTIERLAEGPDQAGWWMFFVLLREGGPTLVGSCGYKGPPSSDGVVEVGYGIVSDHRRRGFATEVTLALVERAFSHPTVRMVIAETLPELVGSIGVLERCGFRQVGEGSEPGVLRFEQHRHSGAGTG